MMGNGLDQSGRSVYRLPTLLRLVLTAAVLQYNSDFEPQSKIPLKSSEEKEIWAISFVFSFSTSLLKCSIDRVKKWGEECLCCLNRIKQYPRQWKRHSFNLTRMKTFFLLKNHLKRVYIHIYKHKEIPTSRRPIQYYFPQHRREGWVERMGGDEHVLRDLFSLSLYQLSYLKSLERVNHKRVQSLGDILFSPSLNTLYHNPGPTQLHSLLHI